MNKAITVCLAAISAILMNAQGIIKYNSQNESMQQRVNIHEKTFSVISKDGYFGLCDALGHVVVSLERGYTFIQLIEADKDYYVITVCKDDYFGVLDLDGNEVIKPNKYSLCVVTKNKILAYENDNCTELNITANQKTKFNYKAQ